MSVALTPIGNIKSMFHNKNGTPRQSGLIKSARASLSINKAVFNNPEHSLQDLSSFSHVWLIWLFHANGGVAVKAKVAPPRLKGKRVGVFSTRSPHRPCPIGLTLAKVERVEDATVHLSGIDLIDGTPVLDIKPYIPQYDSAGDDIEPYIPKYDSIGEEMEDVSDRKGFVSGREDAVDASSDWQERHSVVGGKVNKSTGDAVKGEKITSKVKVPEWVGDPKDDLQVGFTERALKDIDTIDETKLKWLENSSQLKVAVTEILTQDPRSVYRRRQCPDRLYYTDVDTVHVTAWFDDMTNTVEVLRVRQRDDPRSEKLRDGS